MALTKAQVREILSAAGVSAENLATAVDKIIDGHVTSINALREEIATYKADAEKLPTVQKELDDFKAKGDQNWQSRYESEKQAFADYKAGIEKEKSNAEKKSLYTALLKSLKVDEKRIDSILKVTDLDAIKVKDGKFEDEKTLSENAKKDWSGFIVSERTDGADVDNPPENGGKGKEKSRAAQLAEEYQKNMYGEVKK